MSKLDREQEIIQLAAGLQVDWQQNAVQNIIALCHQKISLWLKGSAKIKSIRELETLVCRKLKLVFEEVHSDEDLTKIIRKYLALGEPIFSTLKADLDDKTFATLIERRKVNGRSPDRYVAVIDCRDRKAARCFFTRWHEIAHLLTLQGQLQLPLHRSTTDQSPTERLMDTIAGEIGFYDTLFRPILETEIAAEGDLSFRTIDRVRKRFCPEASFQATSNAAVSRAAVPILSVQVGLGLKKEEQKVIQSAQGNLFKVDRPKEKLRILSVSPNKLVRGTDLQIHRNMEVPKTSILHRLFFEPEAFADGDAEATENLNTWHHSDKSSLANIEVVIRARRLSGSLIALISLGLRR